MENLVMTLFNNIYYGKRVLVTGHTGFKGSWLVLWLTLLGAHVSTLALSPEKNPNHWDLLALNSQSNIVDIRDPEATKQAIVKIDPEIIFHLAAQSLVHKSYAQPIDTWATNVMGTAHVLEACRSIQALKAIIVITTDKCYDNKNWDFGYRETDPLGGHDPYSASKAGAELVAQSYRKSFFKDSSVLLATARAGNVIGGGDFSEDRLIPDLVRACSADQTLAIRSPYATRPWQHVLECLSGYLLLGQKLLEGATENADAWNFGPDLSANRSVEEVLSYIKKIWPEINWTQTENVFPYEAKLLHLDSTKAHRKLNWQPVLNFEDGILFTVEWYKNYLNNNLIISEEQLKQYIETAKAKKVRWACH